MTCRHVLQGHSTWVSDAAVTSWGNLGVTVSGDELAIAWNLETGSQRCMLEGHAAEVSCVVVTQRGR